MHRTRLVGVLAALAVLLSVTVVESVLPVPEAAAAGGGVVDLTGAVPATFTVTPGVEQLTVRGGPVRAPLTLVHADTLERIVTLYTDDAGQLVFQYVPADFLIHDPQTDGVLPTVEGGTVPPGSYRVVSEGVPGEPFAGPLEATDPFDVLDVDDIPDPSLYEGQTLPSVPSNILGGVQPGYTDEDGYGYLETRDGTLLSVNVRLPDPNLFGPGPYPTVIQYSGYAPSKPGTPDGADAGGMLAGVFGFAYVGVNVRGSGCSGGVFDTFNAAQAADGYDVIETVARQPWVKHGKVGMIGISYSGITQIFAAATNPPSLAAIAPMSIIEDPWYQQWSGGLYNKGFTQSWLASRDDEAAGGAKWVKDRITAGDTVCEDNKSLVSQNIPFEAFGRSLERRPDAADARNMSLKAQEIEVPVFLTGAWQDEQTGSRFGLLLDDFDSVPAGKKKLNVANGHHPDGLTPLHMTRWFEFLSFYVDRTIPKVNPLVRAFGSEQLEANFGVPGLGFDPDRFYQADGTTPVHGSFAGALAAYEAEPPMRVLHEVGASPDFPATPGAHRQRWVATYPSWPVPNAEPRSFFLARNGKLTSAAPADAGVDRYSFDGAVLDDDYFVSGDHIKPTVTNSWRVTPNGLGLAYESQPLTAPMTVAGEGYVDLWLRSTGTDVPIEVVLSEVYASPDTNGKQELRVQHGLLRAGYRTEDPARTSGTQVDHLFYAENYDPLTPGEWVNLRVPLYSVSHAFRAGSRVRVEINTPGADSALWNFESDDFGATTHDIARGGTMASSMVLPVIPASDTAHQIPAAWADQSMRPACDSLRGQPCRAYTKMVNESLPAEADDYVPVVPERLLDTRPPQIGYSGPKPTAEQVVELDVTGVGEADVPDDAEAVVLNVTGTEATAVGHVTVYPCGASRPNASNLNLVTGQTVPNSVIVGVGTGGKVCLYTKGGTHLIADIAGWYPAGSSFTPTVPERMLDTRGSQIGYSGPKPIAGQVIEVDLTGRGAADIPDDAEAVVLNVTGAEATADGHITVYPCGTTRPRASNLNLVAGQTAPNLVIVGVGTDGEVCVYTHAGAHLIADVTGWYPAGSPFTPVVPERILETRTPTIGYTGGKPAPGQVVELDVTGVGTAAVPDDAEAVVLNVTGVGATGDGFVTVYPCGTTRPRASNLNLLAGETRPNLVIARVGDDGKVCLYTKAGTHLLADITGYQPPG